MKRMKQIILAAALAALGGTAFAGSSSTTINIGGEVGAGCAIAADSIDLGQVTSFDYNMSTLLPMGMSVNVNCSAGTAYSLDIVKSPVTTYAGNLWLRLDGGTQARTGGQLFPVAGTGTGAEQHYAVTGMKVAIRNTNGMDTAEPTGGAVSGTFAGVFTITY